VSYTTVKLNSVCVKSFFKKTIFLKTTSDELNRRSFSRASIVTSDFFFVGEKFEEGIGYKYKGSKHINCRTEAKIEIFGAEGPGSNIFNYFMHYCMHYLAKKGIYTLR
jgi:hypothetical protein